MFRRFGVLFLLLLLLQLVPVAAVEAGFGITPPYVSNTSLTRSSVYEQQILMVRSNPVDALNAEITVDAPGFEDWIEVLEGNVVLLPAGVQKVPLTVRVTVPTDADFQTYNGNIRIRTVPTGDERSGSVSISLGAQIDVDLTVIDREIKDFRVRRITINDLNEGHKLGWLYFPGKIRFDMLLENTGNVPIAPSRVNFKIYNASGAVLLEDIDHTNRITRINPFGTEKVTAELPTRLPAGNYVARYTIYNEDEIKQEGEVNLSVLKYGTLQTAGYGFFGLSLPHKISVLLPILTLLVLIGLAWRMHRRARRNAR